MLLLDYYITWTTSGLAFTALCNETHTFIAHAHACQSAHMYTHIQTSNLFHLDLRSRVTSSNSGWIRNVLHTRSTFKHRPIKSHASGVSFMRLCKSFSCSDTQISCLFQRVPVPVPNYTFCMYFVQGTLCKARTEHDISRCMKHYDVPI